MAGEIKLNSVNFASESGGTITVSNVDSATNRQNLGLEIGVDVQQYDADTTKNDVANTFTANQIISVTDNTNAALRVTQLGTGNSLVVEDSTNPDSTPFVVDSSGNVGIGTSSPASELNVYHTTDPEIRLTISTHGDAAVLLGDADGLSLYAKGASNELRFYTGTSQRMLIDSNGRLLVTPSETVSGYGIRTTGMRYYNRYALELEDTDQYTQFAGLLVKFKRDGSEVGKIHTTGTSTQYLTASDYRLKENITEITDGISRVKQLNPSRFNFISDPDIIIDGFIAHEVQDIVPESVSGEKDAVDSDGNPEYQGLDYAKLTPLLTAALKEAIEKIEMLEERIAVLEAK